MIVYKVFKSRGFQSFVLVLAAGLLCFELFFFADGVKRGVLSGLRLCYTVILPSIFPFMMLAEFCSVTGVMGILSNRMKFVGKVLFGRFYQIFGIFLMSAVGGYPAAAVALKSACDRHMTDPQTARLTALFAFNPSPAFAITAVGAGMLSSVKQGVIIYVSSIAVSLLSGIVLTRFQKIQPQITANQNTLYFHEGLILSVSLSAKAIITVCATVILFSGFTEPFKNPAVMSFAEVTCACEYLCKNARLSVIAAAVSFGGIASHLQVLMFGKNFGLKYIPFLAVRIINAAGVFGVVYAIEQIFPDAVKTISSTISPSPSISSSPGASAGLIFTCILLLCSMKMSVKRGEQNEKQQIL